MSEQIELHRHLDVSVRSSTLLELAQERGLEASSTSLRSFQDKLFLKRPLTDLNEVLAQFTLFQQVLDRPDVLERVAYETIEDCHAEGTTQVELRFSPGFVCDLSKLKWEDALDGFEQGLGRGLEKHPGMRAGLICIASRDYGIDSAVRTVEFFLKHQERFIGLDLAGNEIDFPCRLFEKAFRPAVDAGAKITVHSGEADGPENIWEAIELLGARRIGHGIAAAQDTELMRTLAERGICLEMCPTSNWITQAVPSLREHPLPRILRAGVPVCINTDDPGIFGVTLPHELKIAREEMGLSETELRLCTQHATASTFLT